MSPSQHGGAHNVLTEAEKEQGWMLLFDGKTTNGWHVFQNPQAKPAWEALDGKLTVNLKTSGVQHGDFATDREFENYELHFDWQITEDGNSGVFINVQESAEHPLAWQTGPEYQLLGEKHHDQANPVKQTGCIFGYAPQLTNTNGTGKWNTSVIKQENGKVEFYLNGNLTTRVDFTSVDWKTWVSESGFNNYPAFAAKTKGHIVLQEWTSPVYFRNIKIREL
ncbi:MAG: DUF1080 domain-containing protein [Alteromonadaceae bacterium]|nr:DUF1080 domain-containing protein [Alteromonadaceae bacterium]